MAPRKAGIVFNREEQLRERLVKAPAEQQRGTDYVEYPAVPPVWAKTQRRSLCIARL